MSHLKEQKILVLYKENISSSYKKIIYIDGVQKYFNAVPRGYNMIFVTLAALYFNIRNNRELTSILFILFYCPINTVLL